MDLCFTRGHGEGSIAGNDRGQCRSGRIYNQAVRRVIVLLVVVMGGLAGWWSPRPAAGQSDAFFVSPGPANQWADTQVVLETTVGTIVLDLLPDAAPNHVAYFVERAQSGAYDGTIFHRVLARGVIQGGDPFSVGPNQSALFGTGGLRVLRFEPNAERVTRGALAAVLIPGEPDSAGAQFFIAASDQTALDGQYTVFARVAEGIGVVDAISTVDADPNGLPLERVEILRATLRDRAPRDDNELAEVSDQALAGYQTIVRTSLGDIIFEFLPNVAPNHVRSFLRLALMGIYDDTAIHRVSPGFVAQGGFLPTRRIPLEVWQEQAVSPLAPEFSAIPHERGVVSMARGDDPASATTSFFIVLAPAPSLDGAYTIFARVVEGFDVLDRIEGVALDGETPVIRIDVQLVEVLRPTP